METCLRVQRLPDVGVASMGPRFCKRGNLADRRTLLIDAEMLQWGHAFVSVETAVRRHAIVIVQVASMGPRFCKRGNAVGAAGGERAARASMGPRFCKRGNKYRVSAVLPRIVIYFTPKGETHDGLLPASSTHSS